MSSFFHRILSQKQLMVVPWLVNEVKIHKYNEYLDDLLLLPVNNYDKPYCKVPYHLYTDRPIVELSVYGGMFILSLYAVHGVQLRYWERLFNQNQYINYPEIRESLLAPRKICPIDVGFYAVTTINVLTCIMWQQPGFKGFMNQNFTISVDPECLKPANLLLTAFSHISYGHLMANTLALYGKLETWKKNNHNHCTLRNSCHGGEFICFYLSSAVFSNLCGLAFKLALDIDVPSVGGSGIVCSLAAHEICTVTPIEICRLPTGHRITNVTILQALALIDVVGFLQMFIQQQRGVEKLVGVDYAIHCGGYVFGVLYAKGGGAALLKWGRCVANSTHNAAKFVLFCVK